MSKFYVICGSQNLVVTAPSAKHAALRLLDEALGAHLWIYEDAGLAEQDRHDHLVLARHAERSEKSPGHHSGVAGGMECAVAEFRDFGEKRQPVDFRDGGHEAEAGHAVWDLILTQL